MSKISLTELKLRCQQGCVPIGFQGELVLLLFLVHSLASDLSSIGSYAFVSHSCVSLGHPTT